MSLCPQCGTANRPGARFCKVCRASLPGATCPNCGESLRPGARFCRRCGQPVPEAPEAGAPVVCPQCGTLVRTGARFCPRCGETLSGTVAVSCPQCGAAVRPGARFCARCGAPLAASPAPATRQCPRCGAVVRPGARFCNRCSQPLTGLSPSLPFPAPSSIPPVMIPGRFGTGDLLPLSTLAGRYVILEKIAQGGMGAVYKAQDQRLNNRIVAVKEMSESAIQSADRETILEAFRREAQLLARLSHPNIVRVSDYFQDGERHYMVMEFIQGRTLEEMLEEQTEPFPEDQVLVWAEQLCDVLAYLHSQTPKIIYRDLKPGNVMVLDGTDTVKLIDFGIARFYKLGKQKDTMELGTPGYAPPEQHGKGQTDERSDLYALGAMLHHLLSLRDPAQHLFDFPPLRSLNPEVSPHVADAIARAVEKERSKRFASAQEMKEALLGKAKGAPKPAKVPAKKKPAPPSVPGKAQPFKVSPQQLDWGQVVSGKPAPPMSLTVLHPEDAEVTVQSPVPWLQAKTVPADKETTEVILSLNTDLLPLGRRPSSDGCLQSWVSWHTSRLVPAPTSFKESLTVELDDGQREEIPVTLTAVPSPGQVRGGWAIAVILLLAELVFALLCLSVLLSTFSGS